MPLPGRVGISSLKVIHGMFIVGGGEGGFIYKDKASPQEPRSTLVQPCKMLKDICLETWKLETQHNDLGCEGQALP